MEEPHVIPSISEASRFELNLQTPNCEKSCGNDEPSMSTYMVGSVANTSQKGSCCPSILNKDNNIDKDKEVGVDEVFHCQNSHKLFVGGSRNPENYKASNTEEISECKQLITFDTTLKKCLKKYATFPSLEVESSLLLCLEINGASSPIQNSSGDQLPIYKRSNSLPVSSELISAMKGGRARNGTLPRMDMRVKWAIDVYDPPTTLMSHTVKRNNHQRPKSKKKDNQRNKKHSKGKNAPGNSSGKKLSDHGPVPSKYSPPHFWLKAGGSKGSTLLESYGKSAVKDVKCGNVFLRESMANKAHPSFAEAA